MTSACLPRAISLLFAVCLALATPLPAAAAAATAQRPAVRPQPTIDVDVALVLAVDVSGSIDYREAELQRRGIVAAFTSREVIAAIQGGSYRQIGVAVVFFSSEDYGVMDVPVKWMLVKDEASAQVFAKALASAYRPSARGTSISDALLWSQRVFDELPYRAFKKVIDVSGDGANNAGRPVLDVRNETLAKGITINALAILEGANLADLDKYFQACVIGGPGSFAMAAESFTDFARAMRRKLVLELSNLAPEETHGEARLIRIAQAAPPARQFLPPGGYAPPRTAPYPGGCDFPMFGGFGFR
jgi:hypothetical protein